MSKTPLSLPITIDSRPFFERVLSRGIETTTLSKEKVAQILAEWPMGIVQIADYFGKSARHIDLLTAKERFVHLVSLALEIQSNGDTQIAAKILNETPIIALSKKGSNYLRALYAKRADDAMTSHEFRDVSEKEFLNTHSKRGISATLYYGEIERRNQKELARKAALWCVSYTEGRPLTFASLEKKYLWNPEESVGTPTESFLFTTIFMNLCGLRNIPLISASEFFALLKEIRAGKIDLKANTLAFQEDIFEEYRSVIDPILNTILAEQIPRIRDTSVQLSKVYNDLLVPYFFRDPHELDLDFAIDEQDITWHRLLKKHTESLDDDRAYTTILFCILLDAPVDVSLRQKTVKELLATLRTSETLSDESSVISAMEKAIRREVPEREQDRLFDFFKDYCLDDFMYMQDPDIPEKDALFRFKQIGAIRK